MNEFTSTFNLWYSKCLNLNDHRYRFCDGTMQYYLKTHFESLTPEEQSDIIKKYNQYKNGMSSVS